MHLEKDYKNPNVPVAERVKDLMSRMTVEEKVNQIRSQLLFMHEYEIKRDFSVGHTRGIAHFMHCDNKIYPSDCADALNKDTQKSMDANRFGIPVLQNCEALHGANWGNATCFPQSIGMAATFDDALMGETASVIAKELRAVGIRQVFSPVINIARDPRWGRTEETYGEDVHLTCKMGVAYVKSLQDGGIIATPKHFVDNYGDGGRDSNASHTSWRDLREVYLEPFRACIMEGKAGSIMSSYNSIDGTPCTCNKKLLIDILRDEWKFDGFTVSDYGGVQGLHGGHLITNSYAEAQSYSLEMGMDVELSDGYNDILQQFESGKVSIEVIDKAVARVLKSKFELGLFETPLVNPEIADGIVRCQEHKDLAYKVAAKSMVLLKNKDNVLPLKKGRINRLGVFGPGANVLSLGGYSGPYGGWRSDDTITPYEALKNELADETEIINCVTDENILETARQCDVALYFSANLEGEGTDRCNIELPSKKVSVQKSFEHAVIIGSNGQDITIDQGKILSQLIESGTKVVVVLLNGSPIDVTKWIDGVDSVLEAWYPGEQGPKAIVDTLFGYNNPGGKLPISFPKSIGQVPVYYSAKPSGRSSEYIENDGKPLFPFGYGLSYSKFVYSDFYVDDAMTENGDVNIALHIKNIGSIAGDEVLQIYIHVKYCSVVRPLKELKAFKRITLEQGEEKSIAFKLNNNDFAFWNSDMQFVTENCEADIMIGTSSEEIVYCKSINI
jgi:beta-glucosidase